MLLPPAMRDQDPQPSQPFGERKPRPEELEAQRLSNGEAHLAWCEVAPARGASVTYADNHPFSPNYKGRIAHEICNPRYPNRVQPPRPESKRKLCAGEIKAGKVLRKIMER